jgi:hypothetical protein
MLLSSHEFILTFIDIQRQKNMMMLNRNFLVISLSSLIYIFTSPVLANFNNISISENSIFLENQARKLYDNREF